MKTRVALSLCLVFGAVQVAYTEEPEPKQLVDKVVSAVGGEDKLLKLFQMRERLVLGATIPPAVDPAMKGGRVSVVEPPGLWWIGTKERGEEPAKILAYCWTLGILVDPKSKLEVLPEITVDGKAAVGLRVSEIVKPHMDLYFDTKDHRLVCIDWGGGRHAFSEWKKTDDGLSYPSRAVGIRFADAKTKTLVKEQWYQTDILELKRLTELPEGLKR